jgi:hypothetical protein
MHFHIASQIQWFGYLVFILFVILARRLFPGFVRKKTEGSDVGFDGHDGGHCGGDGSADGGGH